jgi:choline dehydrogenase-like flavoprotein
VPSFDQLYGRRIREADNVRVCLGIRAQRLETNAAGDLVRAVVGCDAEGRRLRVSARVVVLAAGGIENPRLLLGSTDVHRNGIGNAHDLVGRFFMEHPFVDIPLGESSRACDLFFQPRRHRIGETTVWTQLALSDALMRRERVTGLSLWPAPPAAPPSGTPGTATDSGQPDSLPRRRLPTRVRGLWRDPAAAAAQAWRRLTRRDGVTTAADSRFLRVAFEQAPDPRNQVRLRTERDRFGLPAAELVYRLTDEDVQRHARSLAIAARALGLDGERIAERMQRRWRDGEVYFFWHHMGTTRMHPDPRHGVVNGDCRVHGVSNLFIAGSSVFPTSGTAAPTLTIIALALRLAEHIRQRVLPNASRVT